ncbi:hypothetical protein KI387_033487 [Taxus chinensis]|uniref:FAD-binding PCMH-type domain-containing protein n=1 Tax=Taxus chinensis TaxID=29808 RepID=A0AA38BSS4_TAXCH|nr:hypothetical protein KI387_033487 [Taxus chinensis]
MALWIGCFMALWISLCVLISVFNLKGGDVFSQSLNRNPRALLSCLSESGIKNVTLRNSSSYDWLLKFSLQNLRYAESTVPKPYALIFPGSKEQVQKSVQCCIQHRWEILARSGGHSYEGMSSTSDAPNFVIVDLMKLDGIDVDMKSKTAWVEGGATVGQLYAAIADKTSSYGFPAGVCPTVGVGGHLSGGGMGSLLRKYGLAADHVIDALLVDAKGELLDRKSMGEDLFWALRGGGGGSWGVVVSWKINLVKVPTKLTVFSISRVGNDRVTKLLNRWQAVAPYADEDLFIRAMLYGGQPDVRLTFNGLYLGPLHKLLELAGTIFPEMGMVSSDCNETDWVGSVIFTALSYDISADLRNRYFSSKTYFKYKTDFVTNPISAKGLQGAWKIMEKRPNSSIVLAPLGGAMSRIPSYQLPFPHRAGYLYYIQYILDWNDSGEDTESVAWMRMFYNYMTPYVSKSPRAAYVNYLDLDLGNGSSTVEQARSWGEKYFGDNFDRLVQVKTEFDPNNIFKNAQSIPVLPHGSN